MRTLVLLAVLSPSLAAAQSWDYSVVISDGVTSVNAGGSVVYAITVRQEGTQPSTNLRLNDDFPATLDCTWTCQPDAGATCPASGTGDIVNAAISLPSSWFIKVVFTATCTVSGSATGSITNSASITSDVDFDSTNDTRSDTNTVALSTDLAITNTDGGATSTAGGSAQYTITATNSGPTAVTGAIVAADFPNTLTCDWTCAGPCAPTGSGDLNESINLSNGATATYTVDCSIAANATGSISHTATITAPSGINDTQTNNNSATDTNTLAQSADLSISVTDGSATAVAGGAVTYTIVAQNAGPSSIIGGTISDSFALPLTCDWSCVGGGGGTCTASGSGNIEDTVNIPASGRVTYTASCTLAGSASGTLVNTATATSSASDPTPANNSATDTDTIVRNANLGITITDGVTSANAGTSVTYTITASNAGPSPVTGATVQVPFSLACYWTCVGAGGGTCVAEDSEPILDNVNLPSGASVTYTAVCLIPSSATGNLVTTATITPPGGTTDSTGANNTATDTDTVTTSADLAIAVSSTPIFINTNVTYTIAVTNNGPSDAAATVMDTLPAALSCPSGNINTTLSVASGATVSVTATCAVPSNASGTITNTATVSSSTSDPVASNNSATDSRAVGNTNDVSITMARTGDVNPNGTLTYTIVASNAGPNDALVNVTDDFADALTVTWTCAGLCTASGSGDISETVGLPSGVSATFTVTAVIASTAQGTITNTAAVTVPSGTRDPDLTNNSASDDATIVLLTDLSITNTNGGDSLQPGQQTTYTIVVTNHGPNAVSGARVQDILPATLADATWTCEGACAASGTGDIDDVITLAVDATATYTLHATCVSAGDEIVTTATVASSAVITDSDLTNNTATDVDGFMQAPMPQPDGVQVTLTTSNARPRPGEVVDLTFVATQSTRVIVGVSQLMNVTDTADCTVAGRVVTCEMTTGATLKARVIDDAPSNVDVSAIAYAGASTSTAQMTTGAKDRGCNAAGAQPWLLACLLLWVVRRKTLAR